MRACYNGLGWANGDTSAPSPEGILESAGAAMNAEEQIAVECVGCGQVYHLPPPKEDQRAKCRRCGQQFLIPATAASRRVKNPPARRHAERDRLQSATIASKAARRRQPLAPEDPALRSNESRRLLAGAVVVLLMVGAIVAVVVSSTPEEEIAARPPEDHQRGPVADLPTPPVEYGFHSTSQLIEAIEPAVVQVKTERGLGSGFVLDPAGLIVTCHHCVEGTQFARVVFADRDAFVVSGVRAMGPESDIVILQVETEEPLPALTLTDKPPKKGDHLIAFGSPVGLAFTVSEGAVSALRSASDLAGIMGRWRKESRPNLSPLTDLIQYTATTMPGNSGGPIVNFRGEVVGVTSFYLPYRGQSFKFAISYTEIQRLAKKLDETATPLDQLW